MAFERRTSFCVLLTAALLVVTACGGPAEKPAPRTETVDFPATEILHRMTEHLGTLQAFSVHTQITIEDELESGHIADFDVSTRVLIQRPNKIRAEREGDVIEQVFFYDGTSVTLFNLSESAFATASAPASIEETLDFVRESLDLVVPVADLVYQQAFTLLMMEVTHAVVLGKTVLDGATCDHVLFSRPGVDFQVWVADTGSPLPLKYVVTDTGTPERLSVTTVLSDWIENPPVKDADFQFVAPEGAHEIPFLPLLGSANSTDD